MSNGPRRGIRELKNLPAATKAFSAAANKQQKLQSSVSAASLFVPTGNTTVGGILAPRPHSSSEPSQDGEDEATLDPAALATRRARGVISRRVPKQVDIARIYASLGVDMAASAPEVAIGFLQRALRVAPKDGPLASEIMGNSCAVLNRLGRHAEALSTVDDALAMLKKGGSDPAQLAAMYHNKSCCHEFMGERTAALQAAEKALGLAEKAGLAEDDGLKKRLMQSKADIVKSLTDPSLAKKAAVLFRCGRWPQAVRRLGR